MENREELLRKIPSVDKILNFIEIKELSGKFGADLVKYCVREVLDEIRANIKSQKQIGNSDLIIKKVKNKVDLISGRSLKPVINATGIIIHTNMGRSPFGDEVIRKAFDTLKGYNNLEFDLVKGKRGSRNLHASVLLKYLTGAEDILIVNNNAAAIMLVLRVFAKNKEVIVSRGELIEIGGSFRLPDIMAASDCKMIEVGTTNKTNIDDFENAINDQTSLLFKTHKSNYVIKGFTKDIGLHELVGLGKKTKIPVIYDLGSGLLVRHNEDILSDEPDVKTALKSGVDLLCFSGDKLLGGPQAGIIAGKKEFISLLKKEQMTRALRVGKTTLAFLEVACQNYLDKDALFKDNILFKMLSSTDSELSIRAEKLKSEFDKRDVPVKIEKTKGQYGGGTLPDKEIDSYAVVLNMKFNSSKEQSAFSEKLYLKLMELERPIVSVLKQGKIYFDILTIFDEEIELIGDSVSGVLRDV